MDVLSPKKSFTTLSEPQQLAMMKLRGSARKAAFAQYIDVPPGLADAPPTYTEPEITAANNQVLAVINKISSGNLGPGGIQAAVATLADQSSVNGGPVDNNAIIGMLSDPVQLAPMAQAKIEEMRQKGYSEAAIAAYRNMLTVVTPQRIIKQLEISQQNANSNTLRAQTGALNENSLATFRGILGSAALQNAKSRQDSANAALTQASVAVGKADFGMKSGALGKVQNAITALTQTQKAMLAANTKMLTASNPTDPTGGLDPSDPNYAQTPQGQLDAVNAQLNDLRADQQTLSDQLSGLPSNRVRSASGNNTVQVGHPPKPPTYTVGTVYPDQKTGKKYKYLGGDITQGTSWQIVP